MTNKIAKANVTPIRQRTQYTCMAASLSMCLKANGLDMDEDTVNRVMGAKPMQGASWEQALAAAQHFGMRGTLIAPCTLGQLRAWTDAEIPVMIAWNPEGRPWSHASVVFDVTDTEVYVADPNIPNPSETVRVVSHEDFFGKWGEKWPDYIVRRPALAIEREVTPEGRQVKLGSRNKVAVDLWTKWTQKYPKADPSALADLLQEVEREGLEARDAKDAVEMMAWDWGYQGVPLPKGNHYMNVLSRQLRVDLGKHHRDGAKARAGDSKYASQTRAATPNWSAAAKHLLEKNTGRTQDDLHYRTYLRELAAGRPAAHLVKKFPGAARAQKDLIDIVGTGKFAAYSGNPDGKPIYPVEIDHGYKQPLSGGFDIMKRLQNKLLEEQGNSEWKRQENPRLAARTVSVPKAPKGKLVVDVSTGPNVNLPSSFWEDQRPEETQFVVVNDFDEARAQFLRHVQGLGSSNVRGGTIYDDQGTAVAHVSYNGRLWEVNANGRPTLTPLKMAARYSSNGPDTDDAVERIASRWLSKETSR